MRVLGLTITRGHGCPHMRIDGIYGDRINMTPGGARLECRDCGALLGGPVEYAGDYTREAS